jgi:2-keto-3-deoxy-L-arabinonate dehydratase
LKDLLNLPGIITVLNTPFTAADRVDLGALAANVEQAIAAGVAGFLVPAMASEVGTLTPEEREAMVDAVVRTVRGRAAVIGGASAADPAQRELLARQCIALGCDGVLASIDYLDDDSYRRSVDVLDALRPGFLMLQDWDAKGEGLPMPLIARLFEEVDSFRALKIETVPAGPKYTLALAATGGRLHVSGGWAVMHMIEALDRGVHAFMPTGLHSLYARIYSLYSAGQREAARALFFRVLPILAFSNQDLHTSILFFKRLLHLQGVYPTACVRVAGRSFDAHQARMADELADYAITLMREVEGGN